MCLNKFHFHHGLTFISRRQLMSNSTAAKTHSKFTVKQSSLVAGT